jgi:hypothetical protein
MLNYIVNALIVLALAVWIGSLVFFGAAVAPTLFNPELIPTRTMSGALNSAILGRLGTIEIVAGLLLFGSSFYAAFKYQGWANWGVFVLAVGMLATTFYYTNVLFPKMNDLRVAIGQFEDIPAEKASMKAEFDKGHHLYSTLVKGVLGAGILALLLHNLSLVGYTESGSRRRLPADEAGARKPVTRLVHQTSEALAKPLAEATTEGVGKPTAEASTEPSGKPSGKPLAEATAKPLVPPGPDTGNKEVAINPP